MKHYSTDIAKKLRVKHAYLVNRIKQVKTDIHKVETDDNHPLLFLCSNFTCSSFEQEYRGVKYTAYKMNKSFLILVLGKLKGRIAADMNLWLIFGLSAVEKEAKKMSEVSQAFLFSTTMYSTPGSPELAYIEIVIKNWDKIFPEYKLVGREVETPEGDRIDILAKSKTGRTVIIEVKPDNVSAHKQLRSYAYSYDNPKLVNLTPVKTTSQAAGIEYVVYQIPPSD